MANSLDDQICRVGITDDTFRAVRGPEHQAQAHVSTPPRPAADPNKDRPIADGRCECLACRCKRRK